MTSTRRLFLSLLATAPLALHAEEPFVVYEGMRFDRRIEIAGTALQLNGTGKRAVAWFKAYAAALYLPSRAGTAKDAVAMSGPKRLQLRMFQDLPADEFTKAFRKGIERNTAEAELPKMRDRMVRFAAIVDTLVTVRKGDTVNLDFEPGKGTIFQHNGKVLGDTLAGEDFFASLLLSFVGERPYDKSMRAGLLGQPS